ncbi:PTS sugar transporter subunit IIA [Clostridium neuense]|uniref:PTS sugar transporter subunit IIA n=1 Tax=Clostridium neuense TaxID=1728934 RepID=A0ABW8TIN5_9CLOT
MRKVILASHGELAKGMLNSLSMIIGETARSIEVFCLYPGQSPNDYVEALKTKLNKNDEYIIITDITGGSVNTAFMELTKFENVKLFSGMNMNLILEIILSHPENINENESKTILENAKSGLTYIDKYTVKKTQNDDF